MTTGKKEIVMNRLLPNAFVDSNSATILDRDKTLLIIKNTNLSGSNTSLSYSIMVTPDLTPGPSISIDWITLVSSVVVVQNDLTTHAITDAWDAIKVQAKNTNLGAEATILVYVNRK